jgi:hypothetical protein
MNGDAYLGGYDLVEFLERHGASWDSKPVLVVTVASLRAALKDFDLSDEARANIQEVLAENGFTPEAETDEDDVWEEGEITWWFDVC